jgi:hypothetical protein
MKSSISCRVAVRRRGTSSFMLMLPSSTGSAPHSKALANPLSSADFSYAAAIRDGQLGRHRAASNAWPLGGDRLSLPRDFPIKHQSAFGKFMKEA